MPIKSLPDLPLGSDVFLDANVLIYAVAKTSRQCVTLLQQCATEEVTGITSLHIISEVTHRLMIEEAKAKGLASSNPRKALQEHPERVKQLTSYWRDVQRLLRQNLLFVSINEDIIAAAQHERPTCGFLNNDSLVVAAMRYYGVPNLATRDSAFERAPGIDIYSPSDI